MATGQVTVAAAVSYLGELFQQAKRPNTTLRLLGGFMGSVERTTAVEFPIGVFYNLRAPSQPANLEGAVAPAAQYRSLTQSTNVVQIFHEKVSLSYLAQSDQTMSGTVPLPQGPANAPVQNPRSMTWQVMAALATIAQDANYSFLNGTYNKPADASAAALKTRGIVPAIVTNALDKSADTVSADPYTQYRGYVNLLLQNIITTSGFLVDGTWTLMCGVQEFNNICAAYEKLGTYYLMAEADVVGVKVRKIVTRFGTVNLALDPDMPAQTFAVINFGLCGVVGLEVPGKGILFEEPLYKQGSSNETQIYGQMGCDHGPEYLHGKCKVPVMTL